MGTDIHMVAQAMLPDGTWEDIPCPPELQPEWIQRWCAEEPDVARRYQYQWFDDRNYVVFGVLADVRNGRGFAGIDTGDRVIPIAPPRGLPEDFTLEGVPFDPDYPDEPLSGTGHHRGVSMGDHSFSWLELLEIETYDWDQTIVKRGVVALDEYRRWRASGEDNPDGWAGDVGGGDVVVIPEGGDLRGATHVRCEWKTPLRPFAENFLKTMKGLRQLCGERPTRIVFGFDS